MDSRDLQELARDVSGLPLTIALVDADELRRAREALARGHRVESLALLPPFHVSDDDAYLVLPEDIGVELREMFADGDVDLLNDAMAEGLLAIGTIERGERRGAHRELRLAIDDAASVATLLARMPYTDTVEIGAGREPLAAVNALAQFRNTVASSFLDREGLGRMLREREQASASWRPPEDDPELAGVDPTYAWTRRDGEGRVAIEAALFCEYEELVMVLHPALLRLAAAPARALTP